MERAILIDVFPPTTSRPEAEDRLLELEELVKTYGGLVVVKSLQRRAFPDHHTFIGKGKVEELYSLAQESRASILVVNDILKPRQIYALSEALRPIKVDVWDRIDLILRIFDKHATSAEAKLQIDLARLRHLGPRIFGMGQQLGRQRGGTGTRGGGGEGNTEKMKRHLKEQERSILEKIEKYQNVRDQGIKARKRAGLATVALVGYTNAGKTSLLNALTKRQEYAANKLFATLDTRVGELFLPDLGHSVLLSDTIGFIDRLPPSLIQAFKSTLSEAMQADILLQVEDGSDPKIELKHEIVRTILLELGVDPEKVITVTNKADLIPSDTLENLRKQGAILTSTTSREGIEALKELLSRRIAGL